MSELQPGDVIGPRTIIASHTNAGGTVAFALTREKPGCHYVVWALPGAVMPGYPELFFTSYISAAEEFEQHL